ncbi:type VII secretion-associated serine protease mycosin [Mycobacterium avium]|uniref:type VII secretion-associated serine protease mycosin n=2 Tax=Mycobacterium avium TaxID=1764 RepID=UPI000BAF9ECB|nr:type VII secretion-associated serine protease mycosin [Mycobacterium avium]PBA42270.1 type VII secretion-associated serine protease mycosin [Mycobacterium avium]PBA86018.1 type VII secretion-associated serine protease mycosin [Mycobacterium avium]
MRAHAAASALGAAVLLAANVLAAPTAMAIAPPVIDPGALPPAETPGPTEEMRQSEPCIKPVVIADPDVTQPAPGNAALNIKQAWQYSTGAGVTVAIVDTGVTPNPRFPALFPGGDYVMGLKNGGLSDCENHGTVVASIIGSAPSNPADRPAPKPAGVQGPPPPADIPANPAPTSPPPPPPPAQTVTVTAPPPPPPPAPAPPPPPPPEGDLPADGTPPPGSAQPLVAGPPPGAPDGIVGIAPDATLISIRQSSVAFSPAHPTPEEQEQHRKAGDVLTLAKAIRTAADLGAKVINVSLASCTNAAAPVNQDPLGAAVRYAAVEKDAVVIAAAGNQNDPMQPDCGQNPAFNPLNVDDPRDWAGVRTIVSPAWFSDYVLSVAAVTPEGVPMPDSINGPWVGVAAPGSRIMGLSSENGAAVNASLGKDPGTGNGIWGTSFSAAYVSGVAALVRAKYPNLTAHQVIRRITETAHNPAHKVDNQVGYGVVDPVAALTFDVAAGDPKPVEHLTSKLHVPPAPPAPDTRPRTVALLGGAAAVLVAALLGGIVVIRRRMS